MENKIQRENNNRKIIGYQVMLPLDVGVKIKASESVRLLLEITERLDYKELNAAYARLPSADEASPKQMFQLVILGFMLGQYSTRKLESACKNDIRFMYILGGSPAPDHNRFWKFIKYRLQGEVMDGLFYQLISYLRESREIDLENLFVDGTKIEANANRYSFVWKKSTNKYEAHLDVKLSSFLAYLCTEYALTIPPGTDAEKSLELLKSCAKKMGTVFVHGRGKRKSTLQQDIETLVGYLTRKLKYSDYNQTFKGRSSFSKTDRDATFMRMKEDHMLNGQLKPGYNLQLGVEGGYIVGVNIGAERSDELTLLPLLERMEKGLGVRHKNVIADAGYESEENYKCLAVREQTAYIKPQNYEKSKKRKYKTNAFLRENMPYNAEQDTYTCPNGNTFTRAYTTKRRSASGFESDVTVYECHGCNTCPQKKLCTRAKENRKLSVSKDFQELRAASLSRITCELGKTLRLNRSIQSDGTFGVLKQDYGFRRFLRRGTTNVFTETLLYSFAFNINKLHLKKIRKLLGVILYQGNSA